MRMAGIVWPFLGVVLIALGLGASPASALEGTLAVLPSVTPEGELIGLVTVDDAVVAATQQAFSRSPRLAVVGGKPLRKSMFDENLSLRCRADDAPCMSARARAQRYSYLVSVVLIPVEDGVRLELGLLDVEQARFVYSARTLISSTSDVSELTADTTRTLLAPALVVGQLNVVVSEADATILLDGTEVGVSPLRQPLSWLEAGSHDVEVRKQGFHPFQRRVVVVAGGSQLVDVQLVSLHPPEEVLVDEGDATRRWQVDGVRDITPESSEAEGLSPGSTLMWVGGSIAAAGIATAAAVALGVYLSGLKQDNDCAQDPRCDEPLERAFPLGLSASDRTFVLAVFGGGSLAAAGAGGLVAFIGAGWSVGASMAKDRRQRR